MTRDGLKAALVVLMAVVITWCLLTGTCGCVTIDDLRPRLLFAGFNSARQRIDPNDLDAAIRRASYGTFGLADFRRIEEHYERLPGWRMGMAITYDGLFAPRAWVYTGKSEADYLAGPPKRKR